LRSMVRVLLPSTFAIRSWWARTAAGRGATEATPAAPGAGAEGSPTPTRGVRH
jgi:hypothetical protein